VKQLMAEWKKSVAKELAAQQSRVDELVQAGASLLGVGAGATDGGEHYAADRIRACVDGLTAQAATLALQASRRQAALVEAVALERHVAALHQVAERIRQKRAAAGTDGHLHDIAGVAAATKGQAKLARDVAVLTVELDKLQAEAGAIAANHDSAAGSGGGDLGAARTVAPPAAEGIVAKRATIAKMVEQLATEHAMLTDELGARETRLEAAMEVQLHLDKCRDQEGWLQDRQRLMKVSDEVTSVLGAAALLKMHAENQAELAGDACHVFGVGDHCLRSLSSAHRWPARSVASHLRVDVVARRRCPHPRHRRPHPRRRCPHLPRVVQISLLSH
jgi:hypothetical protein